MASLLARGNAAMRAGDYETAGALYAQALAEQPALERLLRGNLRLARRRLQAQAAAAETGLARHFRELPAGCLFQRKLREITPMHPQPGLASAIRAGEQALATLLEHQSTASETPLVSVIMPTYDRAAILADAITTVCEQRYPHWELWVCDDGSTDDTAQVVAGFDDPRIHYLPLSKQGAAAARNRGLEHARGTLIAYLDSDNYWHPDYLGAVAALMQAHPGRSAVYLDYLDYRLDDAGRYHIKSFERPRFDHERLLEKNFIDLNSFAHRRELYDCFGGFDEALLRRQDYDLILKYTWLRDPLHFPHPLNLYQRNPRLNQITLVQQHDRSCETRIGTRIEGYLHSGLPRRSTQRLRRVTILSWDLCRNHFSKAFALAEALAEDYEVQLLSFDFFGEGVFEPVRAVRPAFETCYLRGGNFPDFFSELDRALESLRGELLYVVKPRLPSLGLALLANQRLGIPLMLEVNDLETVVNTSASKACHAPRPLEATDWSDPELLTPYSERWSQLLDPLARELPVVLTHNQELDAHFDRRCLYMRNIKDERIYDLGRFERARLRAELGFGPEDRVILFGGLLREHKGVFELVRLLDELKSPLYKLLFVASRPSPEQARLVRLQNERVRVLPAQDREAMARINLAADLVILWLNPAIPASRYQMPYKATDALAMGTPIIANDLSDLGELGRQGYLRLVPFGDWDGMRAAITALFDDPQATERLRLAGRRLFRRQFSYAAARAGFELAVHRVLAEPPGVLPAAARFSEAFADFRRYLESGR